MSFKTRTPDLSYQVRELREANKILEERNKALRAANEDILILNRDLTTLEKKVEIRFSQLEFMIKELRENINRQELQEKIQRELTDFRAQFQTSQNTLKIQASSFQNTANDLQRQIKELKDKLKGYSSSS